MTHAGGKMIVSRKRAAYIVCVLIPFVLVCCGFYNYNHDLNLPLKTRATSNFTSRPQHTRSLGMLNLIA